MSYRQLLSQMIEQSGLSLREIARRCNEKGQKIDASYISKLQTGKQITASEEINRTIAEVCGGNTDQLIWDGYMEKAPSIIRDYVNATLPSLKETMNMVFPLMFPAEQANMLSQHIGNMSPVELIKVVNEQSGPIIGNISDNYKLTEIDGEKVDIDLRQTIGIPMMDASMEMLIPCGAIMKLEPINGLPKNGSIIVYKKTNSIYVRRWYLKGNEIFLMPANSNYEPTIEKLEELQILGKVKSYTANL